jgi:Family of unknown function (DUF6529)
MSVSSNADPAYRPVGDPLPPEAGRDPAAAAMLIPFLIGAAVALTLGAYGSLHTPAPAVVNVAGFSSGFAAKAWLASVAVLFALVQVGSALVMYGKVPGVAAPGWIGPLHRWSGRIAFLLTIPVVIHCLYAAGFQTYSPRVLLHSVLGCVFFGAFTVKMLALRRDGLRGWVLPVLGGVVFTALVGLWLTSSLWFFSSAGVTL